ncbi:MAG: helix-turn-helix domain-containing protein [Eubacterium sp.]|nr:helix-turn-helix domain-containing protein [Eubacterium sp.]
MKSFFRLPNRLFSAELSNNEFTVFSYLLSVHSNIKSQSGTFIRVRQSTIAQKCGIKTTQTVSRIISSLMKKGYISHVLRAYRADRLNGTNTYVIPAEYVVPASDYTVLKRTVFSYGLSPAQLKVYFFVIKSIDRKLGYMYNSYSDIAHALKLKRDDVMKIINQLVLLRRIRKIRRYRYDNMRVLSDNTYNLRPKKMIHKRPKKELQPHFHKGCNIFSQSDVHSKNICSYNIIYHCESQHLYHKILKIFFRLRGSPQNRRSI